MATSTTLAHYILDRISQDISFLAETGFLTKDDEDLILKRLASAQVPITPDQPAAVTQPIKVEREVSLASSMVSVPSPASMPLQSPQYPLKQVRALTGTTPIAAEHVNALKRAVPPPPTPPVKLADYARALWDYNVDGNEPNDLIFHKGDIIEVVRETNDDWWEGTTRGRTGLFPSNHAQRIPYDPHLIVTPTPMSTPHRGQIYEKPRYPATGPNMPTPPPTQPPFVTTGEDGEGGHNPDQERKNKFQKLRGQVGNSVANGFGFGAGAAVGSGIVNAIF